MDSGPSGVMSQRRGCVESRCDAVAVGRTYLYPPLSSGGASLVRPWLRFHIPLIEPDMRISRIRLSDKTSRLHPRRATTKLGQAYEAEVLVKVREWISSALASPDDAIIARPRSVHPQTAAKAAPLAYSVPDPLLSRLRAGGKWIRTCGPIFRRARRSDLANFVSALYRVAARRLCAEKPWGAPGPGVQAEF